MHIRLGDYFQNRINLDITYYQKLFNENKDQIIIFCENKQEVIDFLDQGEISGYRFADEIDTNCGKDPLYDLYSLASSRIMIGSNSTFSYIAALRVGLNGGRAILPAKSHWTSFDHPPSNISTSGYYESLLKHPFLTLID